MHVSINSEARSCLQSPLKSWTLFDFLRNLDSLLGFLALKMDNCSIFSDFFNLFNLIFFWFSLSLFKFGYCTNYYVIMMSIMAWLYCNVCLLHYQV